MIAKFFIEKIIASGSNGKESVISFTSGLNVIYGQPNTGKSCVMRCINFIFGHTGESKDPTHGSPFAIANTGYDTVKMIVSTDKGKITFTRKIDETKIAVNTAIDGIESITYHADSGKRRINEVWLQLLGIEDAPQIISKQDFSKKQTFTWKTIKQMFFISETRIIKQSPIFYPEAFVNETYIVASLMYLLTGKSFDVENVKDSKKTRKIGRDAIKKYIITQIEQSNKHRKELIDSLDIFDSAFLEQAISKNLKDMSLIEEALLKAADRIQELLEKIYEEDMRLAERNVVKNRYCQLKGQYLADIKRLHFISDGENLLSKRPRNTKCPVCDGDISKRSVISYAKAIEAEAARINVQIIDLEEAHNEIEREIAEIESTILKLKEEQSDIEILIAAKLTPQKDALKENLATYRATVLTKSKLDAIDHTIEELDKKLSEMSLEEQEDLQSELKFLPKLLMATESEFINKISDYIKEMLEECDYADFSTARFDIDRFDICVDGRAKIETNFGKGYIAYLNTVLAFCVMRYLGEHGTYAPRILIADSPTVSFRLIGDDGVSDRMKNGLYKYLLKNQNYGQVIFVENDIPSVDLVGGGANVIHFTKDKDSGRYGFLEGVHK